eukprot:scaffold125798_cov72-Phaeocystis_antarctica.AAC.5
MPASSSMVYAPGGDRALPPAKACRAASSRDSRSGSKDRPALHAPMASASATASDSDVGDTTSSKTSSLSAGKATLCAL